MNAVSARMTLTGSTRPSSSRLPSRSVTVWMKYGFDADAAVREHGVGAGDLEQRSFARAERDRQVRRELAREAEPLRVGHHDRRPDLFHHLDRRDVARILQRAPQRHRSLELVVVILRLVDLSGARRVADRLVHDQRRRGQAAVDRRRIDDRLERRSELAVGLHGAIELAPAEVPAADHRANLTRPVVDRDERPFDERRLLERHDRLPGSRRQAT